MFLPSPSFTKRDIDAFVDGIEEDVKKLNNTYVSVKAGLSDAESRQLKEETVRVWVERLRAISYEIEDALDVWNTVLLIVQISGAENTRGSNSYQLSDCSWLKQLVREGNFPSRIRELNERLDDINKQKDAFRFTSEPVAAALPQRRKSASFIKASTVCGRDPEIQRLVENLCDTSRRKGDLEVISVVGMGGIGKTTLAQRVYNDATVKCHFQKRIWACVSDPFDEVQVCKAIAKSLGGNPSEDLQDILEYINGSIAEKRYLLVLDDVWTEDSSHWESLLSSLDSGADGGKILVTTRKIECARAIGSTSVHPLGQLSPDDSWKLFSQVAFFNKSDEDVENLKEVGQKIADKCKGLPLAIKAIASHLQYKNNTEREWQRVFENEIWELETAEKQIFKPLLLSYYDLPSPIKKCFSFCAVFPKDYKFEVEELIRLWMSQGYLNNSRNEDMETVGEEYFQHLVTRSFFQDLKFEEDLATISRCKMHDVVHDFAQFLSKDESLIIDNKKPGLSSCEKLRHLTVLNAIYSREDVMSSNFSSIIQQRLHLHTLRIPRSSIIRKIGMMNFLQNLSQHLCFVKALYLSSNGIVEVPEEIGQLVHLRYLNLSVNRQLKTLPGTIYELCNLQTLLLVGCPLRALPKGIEKLINLRHLEIGHHLTVLPKGIGSVSSLRTLDVFIVDRDEGYGREVGAAAATIGDLGNLNNLHGRLHITRLKNVKDGREASKAELRNKKGLTELTLDFGKGEGIKGRHEEEVIEALEPPCHSLENLEICNYSGKLLPRWISSSSLTKLRVLYLFGCRECEELPPLGQLPSLEKLEIRGMNSCKRIGEEFLGMKRSGGGRDGKKMTTTSSIAVAFPKLKILYFMLMKEWREWEDILITGDDDDDLINFKLFPCLDRLMINRCGKLKSLPQFISKLPIGILGIRNCPILEGRCRPETGEDWSKISHIPNIIVLNGPDDYPRTVVTVFEIKDGQLQRSDTKSEVRAVVATIGDLGNLNNLHGRLHITHLRNVKDGREASKAELRNKKGLTELTLDFGEGEGIKGHEEEVIEALEPPCHSLEELKIILYNGKLLPRWIASSSLTKLRVLNLRKCMTCVELPPLGQLPSLEKLHIQEMNSCKRIGEEFLGMKRSGGERDGKKMTTTSSIAVAFPKLKVLYFFFMEEWREWEDILITGDNDDDLIHFKLFPCLDRLEIRFCEKLKSLPQFISKSPIQFLKIHNCDILEERCRPETGEDWSKISHIPNIKVTYYDGKYRTVVTVFEIKDGQLQGT